MRAALFAQVGFQVQFRCFWVTKNAVNQLSRWCPELQPPQAGLQQRCSFAACTDLQLDYAHVQRLLHSRRHHRVNFQNCARVLH